jgi:hypothetical protein
MQENQKINLIGLIMRTTVKSQVGFHFRLGSEPKAPSDLRSPPMSLNLLRAVQINVSAVLLITSNKASSAPTASQQDAHQHNVLSS